jgi:hypothetical protein
MHLIRATAMGVVTSAGPRLTYDTQRNPSCSCWLDCTEVDQMGPTRHS